MQSFLSARKIGCESRFVQCAGGTFREGQIGHLAGAAAPSAALRSLRAVDWVTFGGVLIRREVIRACGPFDDRYRWAYVMDVDYCFEARLRGFSPIPGAGRSSTRGESDDTLYSGKGNPQFREHMSHNYELFYEKWRPFSAALPSIA